jgi:hypothetical protein
VRLPSAAAVLALCTSAACGDPLVRSDYEGTPMIAVHGIISLAAAPVTATNPLVGIQWKAIEDGNVSSTYGPVKSIGMTALPSTFELDVVDAPPREVRRSYPIGDRMIDCEVGCPVVFDDLDGDGQRGANEPLLAVSLDQLIVHIDGIDAGAALDARFTFIDSKLAEPGFHLVQGVCQGGVPGTLAFIQPDSEVDVRLLDPTMRMSPTPTEGNCTRF